MVYQPRDKDGTEYKLFRVLKVFARYMGLYPTPAPVIARYGQFCAARNRAVFEVSIRNDILKARAAFKTTGNPDLCGALPICELAQKAASMIKELEIKYQKALSALDMAQLPLAS